MISIDSAVPVPEVSAIDICAVDTLALLSQATFGTGLEISKYTASLASNSVVSNSAVSNGTVSNFRSSNSAGSSFTEVAYPLGRKTTLRINAGYGLAPAASAAVKYWCGKRSWSAVSGSELSHTRGSRIVGNNRVQMTAEARLRKAFRTTDKNVLALITILSDATPFSSEKLSQVNFARQKNKDIIGVALHLRSLVARSVKPSDGVWAISESQETADGPRNEVLSVTIPGRTKGKDLTVVINRADDRIAHAFGTGTFRPNTKLETHIFSKGSPGEADYYNPPPMGISGQVWLEARSITVFVGDFNGHEFDTLPIIRTVPSWTKQFE